MLSCNVITTERQNVDVHVYATICDELSNQRAYECVQCKNSEMPRMYMYMYISSLGRVHPITHVHSHPHACDGYDNTYHRGREERIRQQHNGEFAGYDAEGEG